MTITRKLLGLPATDHLLLLSAAVVVSLVTAGLRLFSFENFQRRLVKLAHQPVRPRLAYRPAPERITWAVRAVSRVIPAATCLPQALAAYLLLHRHGYPVWLRIGVARSQTGALEAHAWVVSQNKILIGHLPDLARFAPLSSKKQGML